MTQERMRKLLELMLVCYQRVRSITSEGLPESSSTDTEGALAFLFPWLYGKKCPIPAISKVLEKDYIPGINFYNFMYITFTWVQGVWVMMDIKLAEDNDGMPDIDIKWVPQFPERVKVMP